MGGHRVSREGVGRASLFPPTLAGNQGGLPQFFMEATEAVSGVDVGRLEVEDRDLPGSPNWAAKFTILEGDPDGQFAIRTDPKTNEGVLSVVKVSGAHCAPSQGRAVGRAEEGVPPHTLGPHGDLLCICPREQREGAEPRAQEVLGLQPQATLTTGPQGHLPQGRVYVINVYETREPVGDACIHTRVYIHM